MWLLEMIETAIATLLYKILIVAYNYISSGALNHYLEISHNGMLNSIYKFYSYGPE